MLSDSFIGDLEQVQVNPDSFGALHGIHNNFNGLTGVEVIGEGGKTVLDAGVTMVAMIPFGPEEGAYAAANKLLQGAKASKCSALGGAKSLTSAAKTATSIAHDVPWAQMTQAQRNALKHSYMRHGKELGLPNWSESNAAVLQQQFNNVVGHIRQNGNQLLGPINKPWNGQLVKVNFFDSEFHGTKDYYYEDVASGTFITDGKTR